MAKVLQFPNRDPYKDFTSEEIMTLLRASIALQSKRTAAKLPAGTDALTITPGNQ